MKSIGQSQAQRISSGDMPAQNAFQGSASAPSSAVRPNGLRIERLDSRKKTANFFVRMWEGIKKFVRGKLFYEPAYALSSEQLQCLRILRIAGIGENATRLPLCRQMVAAFDEIYHEVIKGAAAGDNAAEAHREAAKLTAEAIVNVIIAHEKAEGRCIPSETLDFLRQKLEKLKDGPQRIAVGKPMVGPQPTAESQRNGTRVGWGVSPDSIPADALGSDWFLSKNSLRF